ncbi:MAG TPA: O-antigen ligase family protein [Flavobacteriales bacterium]
MIAALRSHWVPLLCGLFIVVNSWMMAMHKPWLNFLPVVLLVLWALLTKPRDVLLFVVFATPLSLNLEQLELGGIGVALPTEPLMVALMGVLLLRLVTGEERIDPGFLHHPVTRIVLLQLLWMAVCIAPSSMPLVSLKYLAARLWFVCTMYFMAGLLFRREANFLRFLWCFVAGTAIVVVYTLVHHAQFGFAHDPAHWVMAPFFKDHTSYGAILALVIPFLVTALGMERYSAGQRFGAFLLLVLVSLGFVFSFTRAAWVSLAAAVAVFVVMRLRIPAWLLGVVAVVGGSLYLLNQDAITRALERNQQESSDDLAQHVTSISNVSSDASNLERINRWNSALRMFEDRPFFGWGPGTYMFQYAPFQAAADRTIISTNFGAGGNAHSEYLGPLAEQGVPGALIVVLLFGTVTTVAVRLWSRLPPGLDRQLTGAAFFGLMTYYVHGVLNNYLDLDKASVPFWGFTAMIVVLDLKYRKSGQEPQALSRELA